MFFSWQLTLSNGEVPFSLRHRVFNPNASKTARRPACDHCRYSKAKCTGEEGPCERCQTLSRQCSYAVRNKRKSLRDPTSQDVSHGTTTLHSCQSPSQMKLQYRSSHLSESPGQVAALFAPSTFDHSMSCELQWVEHKESQEQESDQSTRGNTHATDLDVDQLPLIQGIDTLAGRAVFSPDQPMPFDWDTISITGTSQWPSLEYSHEFGQFRHSDGAATKFAIPTLHIDTIDSTGGDTAIPSSSKHMSSCCQCLHHVLILMDKLELRNNDNLDSISDGLGAHKEAVQQGARMINCATCSTKMENMMVLGFLVHKLAQLCCRIFGSIAARETHFVSGTAIGAYKMDSPIEFTKRIRDLLYLQMCHLGQLVDQLEYVAAQLCVDTLDRRLVACKEIMTWTWDKLADMHPIGSLV